VNVNTSNVMGVALLGFGVALAALAGASGDRNSLGLGFIGAAMLFYMGIGLYSRGNTESGLLRASDETTRRSTLYRTSSYVAALAAAGALVAFMYATVTGESLTVRALFGVVFLYTLPVSVRLRRMSSQAVEFENEDEQESESPEDGNDSEVDETESGTDTA